MATCHIPVLPRGEELLKVSPQHVSQLHRSKKPLQFDNFSRSVSACCIHCMLKHMCSANTSAL